MKKLLKAIEEIDTRLLTDAQKRRLNRAKYVATKLSKLNKGDELTVLPIIALFKISAEMLKDAATAYNRFFTA